MVQYNADGSLDESFAGDGIVTTAFFGTGGAAAEGVAIQADGRIVLAGEAGGFLVGRFGSDGTVDSTFGNAGVVVTSFGNDDARWTLAEGMALQPDGRRALPGRVALGRLELLEHRVDRDDVALELQLGILQAGGDAHQL
jgi:hypothetical protein